MLEARSPQTMTAATRQSVEMYRAPESFLSSKMLPDLVARFLATRTLRYDSVNTSTRPLDHVHRSPPNCPHPRSLGNGPTPTLH